MPTSILIPGGKIMSTEDDKVLRECLMPDGKTVDMRKLRARDDVECVPIYGDFGDVEYRPPPPLICDGCNVREPHEHKCHEEMTQVGNRLGTCECPDCHPSEGEFAEFRKRLEENARGCVQMDSHPSSIELEVLRKLKEDAEDELVDLDMEATGIAPWTSPDSSVLNKGDGIDPPVVLKCYECGDDAVLVRRGWVLLNKPGEERVRRRPVPEDFRVKCWPCRQKAGEQYSGLELQDIIVIPPGCTVTPQDYKDLDLRLPMEHDIERLLTVGIRCAKTEEEKSDE